MSEAIAAAAVGGGIDLAGTSISNIVNYQTSKHWNQLTKEMSNTAHQREVQDLRAAGLNPILSATGGRGLDVPKFDVPHMESPTSGTADKLLSAIMTEQSIKNSNADIGLKQSAARLNDEQAKSQISNQKLNSALEHKAAAETESSKKLALKLIADEKLSSAQAHNASLESKLKDLDIVKQDIEKEFFKGADDPASKKVMGAIEYLKHLLRK